MKYAVERNRVEGWGLDLSDLAHGSVAALANIIITFGFYIMNEEPLTFIRKCSVCISVMTSTIIEHFSISLSFYRFFPICSILSSLPANH